VIQGRAKAVMRENSVCHAGTGAAVVHGPEDHRTPWVVVRPRGTVRVDEDASTVVVEDEGLAEIWLGDAPEEEARATRAPKPEGGKGKATDEEEHPPWFEEKLQQVLCQRMQQVVRIEVVGQPGICVGVPCC